MDPVHVEHIGVAAVRRLAPARHRIAAFALLAFQFKALGDRALERRRLEVSQPSPS